MERRRPHQHRRRRERQGIYAGTVTVQVDPRDDVKCLGLTVTGDTSGDEIPVTRISNGNTAVCTFEMPKEPVTVVAELDTFSVTYAVAGVDEGGSVSGATYAAEGYPVTFTVTIEDGYVLADLTVIGDESGAAPGNVYRSDNEYLFIMPAESVTVTATFAVERTSIGDAVATGIDERYDYTGDAITPEPTVALPDGTLLVKDVDYTVEYVDNVEPGTATVVITGIGDYEGTVDVPFVINADKTALQALVDSTDGLVATDYTLDSWVDLQVALRDANNVLADPDATQAEVAAAYDELAEAIDGLVPAEADKSALEDAIDTADGLIEGGYTPESWQAMEDALIVAKDVAADPNATQAEVDAATEALNEAMDILKIWFHDVTDPDLWYFDAVYGMAEQGFVTGYYDDYYGDGTSVLIFNHGGIMDRAQLATVLWHMAGESEVTGGTVFTDVDYGEYYGMAVRWAYEEGVITGYEDAEGNLIFDPSGALDFEAMVAMIARASIGADAVAAWPTDSLFSGRFSDADQVDDWARTAMAWAIDCGLVTGGDNGDGTYTLDPGDHTARGRAATVLWRAYGEGLL